MPAFLSSARRGIAALTAWSVVAAWSIVTGVVAAPAAEAAAGDLTLGHDGTPASVLAGTDAHVTMTAAAPSSATGVSYNVTFVATLPAGATYVAGSSTPAAPALGAPGEPTVTTVKPDTADGDTWYQVLTWSNVTDLPVDGEAEVGFDVRPDEARFPVGSTVDVATAVLGSADPRTVPKVVVDTQATSPSAAYTVSGASSSAQDAPSVTISPLRLTKSEPSPESELLRGLEDQRTEYTLTVTTAEAGGTDGVLVTDYVPAQLHFLGCVSVSSGGCATLQGATVVTDPVGLPAGVYTKVVWDLGDLGADSTVKIVYRAAAGTQELAADGDFDGASTRQEASPVTAVNRVGLTGTYTGPVASSASTAVDVDTEHTVELMDVALEKSTTATTFVRGGTASYALHVRVSQYTDASGVSVTDTLPDGMCPYVESGTTTSGTWPSDCSSLPRRDAPGATMTTAVAHADGTFTVTFELPDLAADATRTVEYDALMRTVHHDGTPTSTGDSFTNHADVAATTTPVAANTVEHGDVAVDDDSEAALSSGGPTLSKAVWPNADRDPIAGAAQCPADTSSEWTSTGQPVAQLGDLLCFQVQLTAAPGVALRDAVVTDFVPVGTQFVDWRVAANDQGVAVVQSGTDASWKIGDVDGSHTFVPAGASVTLQIVVRVVDVSPSSLDILGNLAKLRASDVGGHTLSARAEVGFAVAPAAPLSLTKQVSADGSSGWTSDLAVRGEDHVTYRLRVKHTAAAGDPAGYPLDSVTLWDALPSGWTCAAVADPALTCAIGTSGSTSGRAVVKVTLTGAALGSDHALTAGETIDVPIELEVPSGLSIASVHTNDASIVSYTSPSTDASAGATPATFRPAGSLADPTDPNAPAANASAKVHLPNATVSKNLVSTSRDETGNSATQATVGETATYTYSVTIPAGTAVFNGRLTDAQPTVGGVAAAAVVSASATDPAGAALATCDAGAPPCLDASTGTITFPPTLINQTASDWTYTVTLTARVLDAAAVVHGTTLTDAALFTSTSSAASSAPISRDSKQATVTAVLPAPKIVKSPLKNGTPTDPLTAGAGEEVTYRLTASNAASRPPLHDAAVTDCLPAGMTYVGHATTTDTVTTGTCGTGGTRTQLTWVPNGGTVDGGQSFDLEYTVRVDAAAGSGVTLGNTATLTGSTLPGAPAQARALTASDTGSVTVYAPAGSKTADRSQAVPGEVVTWTVTATLPAHANFYDLTVLDTVPAGLTPDLPGSVVTCGTGWASTAACDGATVSTQAGTGGTTKVAWSLGDVTSSDDARTVTVTVRTTVSTGGAGMLSKGAQPQNVATLGWFTTADAGRTVDAGTTFESSATLGSATVLVKEPSVTVAKSVDDAVPGPNQVIQYTVRATASAASPSNVTAYAVVVVDTVPAGIVPLDASGDPVTNGGVVASGGVWNASTRTLTWQRASLASGATATYTYDARLAASSSLTGAALTNTVRAQSWQSLASAGRGYGPSAAKTASVTPQFPRVTTTKSQVTTNPVYVGQHVGYEVRLANTGTATAATTDAVDVLPKNWQFVSGSATVQVPSGTGPVALADPTVTGTVDAGQTLTWTAIGGSALNLAPGATVVVRYEAEPLDTAASATGSAVAHTNTARAAGVTDLAGGTSYNAGAGSYVGPSGSATARIDAADLRITKTSNTWVAGTATNTWTIAVENLGPDPAVGVTVKDELGILPSGAHVTSVGGTGWTCSPASGGYDAGATCVRGTALAAGGTASLTVTVALDANATAGATATNTATVTADTFDPATSNNLARDTATVTAVADLGITKTGPTNVTAGSLIAWQVVVTNHGPSVSRGSSANPIVVVDTLPAHVTMSSITTSGGGVQLLSLTGGVLRLALTTDIAAGGTVPLTLNGRVDADATSSPLVNAVTVTPVTPEGTNTHTNSASATTTLGHSESLTIEKDVVGDLVPGSSGTYEISVHNGGPSAAPGVVVSDPLPAGLTFAGNVSNSAWTCTGTTSVTCELSGSLGVGSGSTFTFDVDVASSVTGDIENTATVGSTWLADQDDSTATTGPRVTADLGITKTHTGGDLEAGTGTTFTLKVTNHGPSDAPGPLTITDHVPGGLPVDGTIDAGAGTCTVGADLPDGSQPVTCVLAAGLVKSGTWTVKVPVAVGVSAPEATYTNTARVDGPANLDEGADTHANSADDEITVVRRADLSIDKSADASTVTAGTDVTYTLAVQNAGPSVAAATILRDVLPADLAPKSASWAGHADACTITGQTVQCALGDVDPTGGTPITVKVVATVRSSVASGTTIDNTATVSSSTIDVDGTDPTTDSDHTSIDTDADASLTLEKTAVASSVRAGDDASYTLAVTNDGPSDVAGPVTITDTLPDDLTYVASSTTGSPAWVCVPDHRDVTCTLGDGTVGLAAHAHAPVLTLVATVSPSADAGTVTNTAHASSSLSGDSPDDTADVAITTLADLGVTKAHIGTPVAGTPFRYTVTVRNGGPADSRADAGHPIVVVDTLPVGMTFAPGSGGTVSGDGFTCEAGSPVVQGGASHPTVRCERPTTLAAGADADVEIPVDVAADALGTLTNAVTVTPGLTDQPDPQVLADTATDDVTVVAQADLGLVKKLATDPADVVAGRSVSWTIDVTNAGPSTSHADASLPITVVDTLPAGVQDASASGSGWTCTTVDRVITCERDADLAVGAAPVITVDATVDAGSLGALTNTATVTPGSTPQPVGGSVLPDTDDATVTPGTSADLQLDKTVVVAPLAGATGTYRLRVTNVGPSAAQDVVVTDTLPAGLTFDSPAGSSAGSSWTCSGTTTVRCELDGPLAVATTVWFDLVVRADQALAGTVANTATVTSSTDDPDPTNNTATADADPSALAELTLVKSHRGHARIGEKLTFDLAVVNDGPSQARSLTLQDRVPATLTVTGVRAGGDWSCTVGTSDASGTPVLCVLDRLAVGAKAPTVHVDTVVTAAAYPSVTNVATVASVTPSADDPAGASATDDDTVTVPPLVDLALRKTLDGKGLTVGRTGTYLLTVTNAGPTADPGPITVTDHLPTGLTFASARGADCSADGSTVTCVLDRGLAVGHSATIHLDVAVDQRAGSSVVNTASVDSDAKDTDPGNDASSVRVDVTTSVLSQTGASPGRLALLALLLLVIGGAVVVAARRSSTR